jgi:hypothetical protein
MPSLMTLPMKSLADAGWRIGQGRRDPLCADVLLSQYQYM